MALLAGHLRTLSDGVTGAGRLCATLGDGLSGVVADADALRAAVAGANRWSTGRMHSGAGAAPLEGADLDAARRRAHLSLHVTKTLKGTTHGQCVLHVYGQPLGADAAEAAFAFLADLGAAGPGAPGAHYLAHALRWRDDWRLHLPP